MKNKYFLQCVGDGQGWARWRLLTDEAFLKRKSIPVSDWFWINDGRRSSKGISI